MTDQNFIEIKTNETGDKITSIIAGPGFSFVNNLNGELAKITESSSIQPKNFAKPPVDNLNAVIASSELEKKNTNTEKIITDLKVKILSLKNDPKIIEELNKLSDKLTSFIDVELGENTNINKSLENIAIIIEKQKNNEELEPEINNLFNIIEKINLTDKQKSELSKLQGGKKKSRKHTKKPKRKTAKRKGSKRRRMMKK